MKRRKQKHLYIFENGECAICTPEQAQAKAQELALHNNVKTLRYRRYQTGLRRYNWHEVNNPFGRYEYSRDTKTYFN